MEDTAESELRRGVYGLHFGTRQAVLLIRGQKKEGTGDKVEKQDPFCLSRRKEGRPRRQAEAVGRDSVTGVLGWLGQVLAHEGVPAVAALVVPAAETCGRDGRHGWA